MEESLRLDLEKIVGRASVRSDEESLSPHSSSRGSRPEALVRVESREQTAAVVRLANRRRARFILSDQAGSVTRSRDVEDVSFVLDFSGLNRVREVRFTDLFMTVEPGATLSDIDFALRPASFFFPPEPAEGRSASIGRMVLRNPIHPGADKYGLFRDYILWVEAVTPTGDEVKLGAKTLKNSSGVQIERFLSGSGGLLGIPTGITLAVKPKPAGSILLTSEFETVSDCMRALREIGSSAIAPSALELFDRGWIGLGGQVLRTGSFALDIELSGHPEAVRREAEQLGTICRACKASWFNRMKDGKSMDQRRDCRRLRGVFGTPGKSLFRSFALPASAGGEVLRSVEEISNGGKSALGAHAYYASGLLFFSVAVRSTGSAAAEEAMSAIMERAVPSGGGPGASEWRAGPAWDHDRETVIAGDRLSVGLKEALDPASVLSTGGTSMR